MANKNLEELKSELISDIEQRVSDKILERTDADLLAKLINQADSEAEAMNIKRLGTTYKRTGFHFFPHCALSELPCSNNIKYKSKNEKLSFVNDASRPTHELIIGDNFDALQNLMITHKGKVDVIYIDPPYGKDNMGEFAKTNYDNSIDRDNLLSMLYPRLLMAKRLLSKEGVIFCSIDDKNQAYVKCLLDEVFGEESFIANLIWQKKTGASDAKGIATITEYILVYTMSKQDQWNELFSMNYDSFDVNRYKYSDEYVKERGKYYPDNLDRGGLSYTDSQNYGIECPDGTFIFPNERNEFVNDGWTWKWSKEKVEWGKKNGFIIIEKNKKSVWKVYYKNYLRVDNEGVERERNAPYKNIIQGILNTDGTNNFNEIFDGSAKFKNPKPYLLVKYLTKWVAKPNAIILDFFAGSGTSGQAVMELNKEDGGNRSFILCTNNEITEDNPNGVAYDVTTKRLKRIMSGECYDGTNEFPWLNNHTPFMDNLNVYEIAEVSKTEAEAGKTAFDKIDETSYGLSRFESLKDKIKWVCENFENTTKMEG